MNLREGTRRLALLFGAAGAIFGGFLSYTEMQSLMWQKAEHEHFARVENSSVVAQARKDCFDGNRASKHGPWEKYVAPQDQQTFDPVASYCYYLVDQPNRPKYTAKLKEGGTETIHFLENRDIESVETEDGQILYPTPAPGAWSYVLIAMLPILGFLLPLGAVRTIGWVLAGFFQSSK